MKITNNNSPQEHESQTAGICSTCNGNLFIECNCTEGLGPDNAYVDCPHCGGTGTVLCPNCSSDQIN